MNVRVELIKHFKLYLLFLKFNLLNLMEYRANFVVGFIVENLFLLSKILYLKVVYETGLTIDGFSPDYITLYVGTFTIITAIYNGFIVENFYGIPRHIKSGTLDTLITKPVSLQFILTLKQMNFSMMFSNFIGGIIMVFIACNRLDVSFSLFNIIIYILLIISGVFIAYFIFLLPMLLSFWIVEVRALISIADRGWDFNTMPMYIFNRFIRGLCMFVIPILAISNFPSLFLIQKLELIYALWAVIAPLILLVITRLVWNLAVRSYTSANG